MNFEGCSRGFLAIILLLSVVSLNLIYANLPINAAARAILIIALNGSFCVGVIRGWRGKRRADDQ